MAMEYKFEKKKNGKKSKNFSNQFFLKKYTYFRIIEQFLKMIIIIINIIFLDNFDFINLSYNYN